MHYELAIVKNLLFDCGQLSLAIKTLFLFQLSKGEGEKIAIFQIKEINRNC